MQSSKPMTLAGVMTGKFATHQWGMVERPIDFFDTKAAAYSIFDLLGLARPDVEASKKRGFLHPSEGVEVSIKGQNIGYFGRLHPKFEKELDFPSAVYLFELDFDLIKEAYLKQKISYRPLSRYPTVVRDVALLVNSGITPRLTSCTCLLP